MRYLIVLVLVAAVSSLLTYAFYPLIQASLAKLFKKNA